MFGKYDENGRFWVSKKCVLSRGHATRRRRFGVFFSRLPTCPKYRHLDAVIYWVGCAQGLHHSWSCARTSGFLDIFLGAFSAPFFDILKMQQKTPNIFRGSASILVRKLRVSKKVVQKCQKMQNYADFRPKKCRFFGILQKKCKKVIFLLNALIFKKNIFDLLPQNKKTRFFKTILRFPKMDKNKCPKLKTPKKFWENGFFGIWKGILRKPRIVKKHGLQESKKFWKNGST